MEAGPAKLEQTVFLMLKDGHVAFEGGLGQLRASGDEYLRAFLSGIVPVAQAAERAS